MSLSPLEVVVGSAALGVIATAAAWGRSEAPVAWAKVRTGPPFRQDRADEPRPRAVRRAVPVAWGVVVLSGLRAIVLLLEMVSLRVTVAGSTDCASFPCEAPLTPFGPSFDGLSAGLDGAYLVATGAVIGAFARWARDAERDVAQARRLAPLVASCLLVVTVLGALGVRSGPTWPLGLVHVVAVLIGAALIALARRSATHGGAA